MSVHQRPYHEGALVQAHLSVVLHWAGMGKNIFMRWFVKFVFFPRYNFTCIFLCLVLAVLGIDEYMTHNDDEFLAVTSEPVIHLEDPDANVASGSAEAGGRPDVQLNNEV